MWTSQPANCGLSVHDGRAIDGRAHEPEWPRGKIFGVCITFECLGENKEYIPILDRTKAKLRPSRLTVDMVILNTTHKAKLTSGP